MAAASGSVDKLSTAAEVNATGTLNYDLAQVTPLLRPYLGDGIRLSGKEQARFAMAGRPGYGREPFMAPRRAAARPFSTAFDIAALISRKSGRSAASG